MAQQDVDNARANFESAEGDLAEAKKNLDDAVVRAEIGGRVGRTNLEVGGRVTGPSDLLTTIDVLDPIYVSFRPSAQQLLRWKQDPDARKLIQPGSKLSVQVTLPDGTLLPRTGTLDFVAPSLDATTGTQEFRALFHNPDRLLVSGQFVSVRLNGFTRDSALAIPQRAVQQALGRQFVYVVGKGDTVADSRRAAGTWSGNLWIIDKGLAAGDRVIVDGVQKAAPGHPVHPVPLADSAATSPEETARVGAEAGSDDKMTGLPHVPNKQAEDDVQYFFIKRPVLAIVISVIVVLLGVFAIRCCRSLDIRRSRHPRCRCRQRSPAPPPRTSPRRLPPRSRRSCRGSRDCSTTRRPTRATGR